jgi:general secretion pathway protein G
MRLRRGFTLIELMVVLAIMATLAALAVPVAEVAVQRYKERELREGLRQIRVALDQYRAASLAGRIKRSADQSGYPPTLSVLVEGVEDQQHPEKRKLVFMRRLPRDPFAPPQLPAERTWGLRSYASPFDAPEAGDDVFDVYSLADGVGLNGIPYRRW